MKALTLVLAVIGALGFASAAYAGPGGCSGGAHETTAENPAPPATG